MSFFIQTGKEQKARLGSSSFRIPIPPKQSRHIYNSEEQREKAWHKMKKGLRSQHQQVIIPQLEFLTFFIPSISKRQREKLASLSKMPAVT